MRARGKPRLINTLNLVKFGDAGLEEAQAGIKIAGRNIKNLRYAGIKRRRTKEPLDESVREE